MGDTYETHKMAGYVPISLEGLRDFDLSGQYDHLYPDRNPWPTVVLFPSVERVRRALGACRRGVRRASRRVVTAWDVLLHDLPEREDW